MGGFMITVLIAVFIGWLSNIFARGRMPGDAWGASLSALVGAWIGAYMPYFNTFGPKILNIALVPTFLGALSAAILLGVVSSAVRQAS